MRMIFQNILLSSSSPYRGIHVHKAQSNNVKVIWLVKKYYLGQITQTSPILLFAAFPSSFHAFSYGRKSSSDFNWNVKWGFCVKRHTSVLVRKKLKCHHHLHKRLLFLYKIPDISGTINKLKYVQAAPVSLHVICEKLTFDLHHPFTRTSRSVLQARGVGDLLAAQMDSSCMWPLHKSLQNGIQSRWMICSQL